MPKAFKTIEVLALEMNIAGKELIILGINSTPKANSADYFLKLDLFMWSTTLKHRVVVVGDLNLESMRLDKREGKLLIDLKKIYNFKCLFNNYSTRARWI